MDKTSELLFNPFVAWLNVNEACNLRCKWCYAQDTDYMPQREMTLETAKFLVDLSIEMGIDEFVLIGGEPTLWPHLFEILAYIKQHNALVSIITNGVRFSNDEFWKHYIDNPASSLGISVKAASAHNFRIAACSPLYDESLLGIKRAINFHNCGVSAVHNNLLGVEGTLEIAQKCHQMGARRFQLVLCTPAFVGDSVSTEFTIPPTRVWNDIHIISDEIERLYGPENVNYDLQAPLCLFPKEFVAKKLANNKMQTFCHVYSRSGVNFDIDGNIIFCNTIPEIIAERGKDYTDVKSLKKYMNSMEKQSEYLQILRYPSQECLRCIWKENCRGGCIMHWFAYNPHDICHAVS